MRSNFSRRWYNPHAERALVRKRQTTIEIHPDTSSGGFVLTAPTTITFVETITETASSSYATSSSSSRQSESSAIITSSSTRLSTSASSTSTTSLQTPFETATTTTSAPTISPTDANNNGTFPIETGALSAMKVPAGAIAAIVIACLVVILVGLFYLVRQKSRRDRTKRRPKWSSGYANNSRGVGPPANSYRSSRSQPRMQFPTPQPPPPPPMPPVPRSFDPPSTTQIPGPSVTMPPRTYGSTENSNSNDSLDPALSSSSNLDLISTSKAVYTLGANGKRSAFSAIVTSTFITTLPDELSIEFGERLRVVAEYDDGWSLCMNVRGEQGMVPIECLDRSGNTRPELREGVSMSSLASMAASLSSSSQSYRASRRVSSLRS